MNTMPRIFHPKNNIQTNLIIRSFQIGDLCGVSIVDKEGFGQDSYPRFFLRQAYDVFGDLLCVAEKEGQIVGYSLGAVSNDQMGWILALTVAEQYRRIGVAEELTLHLINVFKEKGIEIVMLTVMPTNLAAIKLYEKLGFTFFEKIDDYFGPGEERIVMRKNLKQGSLDA